ncbi:MAG: hypothetical protein ACLGH6_07240 [Gammaproteobacteria bacterium]
MSLHLALADMIARDFAGRLAAPVEARQDALIVRLDNAVTLTVHYAAADAYSLRWTWTGGEAGIDTAPVHRDVAGFPRHLHAPDGRVVADPLTRLDAAPEDNLARVLRAVLDDPGLGHGNGA